ncbi:FAD-dependent monooxygenase [Falsiroseomonas ponticola]|uniref:FAD-dependent monooxygenase n=1 Tax=Falsiroseomonas ponticola TaxID=2786951 RepID=UPI0019324807|nr:FAD-dependent monooxygenase [Roseomonas ponticola]
MTGVVIVGGGPAGSAAAITLARGGARPLLLERDPATREKVCGEFLGADAAAALAGLGIDLAALGAVPVRRAIFAAGRREGRFGLPFAAWSLPRLVLDEALLAAAEASGARVERGVAVTAATGREGDWSLRLADGRVLGARDLVLATGKHELRGWGRGAAAGAVGLKLPLAAVPIGDAIAVLACGGGYAGLQPRAGGGANLCLALPAGTPGLAAAAREPAALLDLVAGGSLLARALLRGAVPLWDRPLAVAAVPYGYVAPEASSLFRIGDQAAVIPSLCGDGIAMALGSGGHAARMILAGQGAARHQAAWGRHVRPGMRVAGLVDWALARGPGAVALLAGWAPGLARWAALRTRLGVPGT